MIVFQASPVEHLISVRKEAPKVQKLTCLFISPAFSRPIKANQDIPMIANMNISNMSKRPRDAIAGVASIRVLKISCSFCCFLIKRKTRPILRVLKIVPRISRPPARPAQVIPRIMIVPTTTVKSKMFQLSEKYCPRQAISLMTASTVKMIMNEQLKISSTSL